MTNTKPEWEKEWNDEVSRICSEWTNFNGGTVAESRWLAEKLGILKETVEKAERRGKAEGRLEAVEVLHKKFMGSTDVKVLDMIEAAQKEILELPLEAARKV